MQRLACAPRSDWRQRLEAIGFGFHSLDGQPYWVEDACYRFTSAQVDELESATQELHERCLELVDRVIERGDCARLGLTPAAAQLAEASWRRREPALYGRMDLSYDGRRPPKLLEYNADTPTALFEAAVVQWYWLEESRPKSDQFNSIHEKLIEHWKHRWPTPPPLVHFACFTEAAEDHATAEYLRDTAGQAGLATRALHVEQIGWNGRDFFDMENRAIDQLFKLYPWEWLVAEAFGAHIAQAPTAWLEPTWKMLLSTKAVLPLLWEMFPRHPYLLPAASTPAGMAGPIVRKPRLGREGEGVEILRSAAEAAQQAAPGDVIYQAYHALPDFGGWRPVIGSWVIGDRAAGIGIREDRSAVTRNGSRFVPHYFED